MNVLLNNLKKSLKKRNAVSRTNFLPKMNPKWEENEVQNRPRGVRNGIQSRGQTCLTNRDQKKTKKKHLRPRLRAMRGARGEGKRGGLMNQPCKGENLRDRYGFNTPAGCGGFNRFAHSAWPALKQCISPVVISLVSWVLCPDTAG